MLLIKVSIWHGLRALSCSLLMSAGNPVLLLGLGKELQCSSTAIACKTQLTDLLNPAQFSSKWSAPGSCLQEHLGSQHWIKESTFVENACATKAKQDAKWGYSRHKLWYNFNYIHQSTHSKKNPTPLQQYTYQVVWAMTKNSGTDTICTHTGSVPSVEDSSHSTKGVGVKDNKTHSPK